MASYPAVLWLSVLAALFGSFQFGACRLLKPWETACLRSVPATSGLLRSFAPAARATVFCLFQWFLDLQKLLQTRDPAGRASLAPNSHARGVGELFRNEVVASVLVRAY